MIPNPDSLEFKLYRNFKKITGLSFVEKWKQYRENMRDIFWRFGLMIIDDYA
jgi:hypothetical protein